MALGSVQPELISPAKKVFCQRGHCEGDGLEQLKFFPEASSYFKKVGHWMGCLGGSVG